MTSTIITADTLNDNIDFDRPFTLVNVDDEHATIEFPEDVHEPDVSLAGNSGAFDISSDKWRAVSGYSGQHGYSGPIMHVSEFLGGGMAEAIVQDGGTYVVVEVRDEDGTYPEGDAIGWMLLVSA